MTTVEALRTPDDRFGGLPDFPYPPHYVDSLRAYEGLRAHYLDLDDHPLLQSSADAPGSLPVYAHTMTPRTWGLAGAWRF
jgi:hypothetical protein